MNREDYQDVLERMEKATGNEVFCDVMCRFPYELNEEQLTEVCERCPLNNTLEQIRAEIESCREDEVSHLCDYRYHRNEGLDMALDIIDKYIKGE